VSNREYIIQIAYWALHLWTVRRRGRVKGNYRPERFRWQVEYHLRQMEREGLVFSRA